MNWRRPDTFFTKVIEEMVIESFGLVNTIQAAESAVSVEALYLAFTK